jgi:hypothetical protein
MEFSEANGPWRSVPNWATFLVELGFALVTSGPKARRIAIVSMPSDSAAAGLISLGAMRKCLELGESNDLDNHFRRIISLAQRKVPGVVLRHASMPGKYVIDEIDTEGRIWVKKQSTQTRPSYQRITLSRSSSLNWQFDGEAPVAILRGEQIPNAELYFHLVQNGGAIQPSNLAASDSGVCLAGSVSGGANTRNRLADIRLRHDGSEAGLCELLTVQEWMPGTVSRIMFFNSRTEEFDRTTRQPQLVIADGDACFLRLLDLPEFEQSDVIGVIHRTMERERLEAVGNRLASLRQWYDPDDAPPTPRGIAISAFRRAT